MRPEWSGKRDDSNTYEMSSGRYHPQPRTSEVNELVILTGSLTGTAYERIVVELCDGTCVGGVKQTTDEEER